MNVFRECATDVVLCIAELIAGILLLLDPVRFASTVITGAGLVLIVLGLIKVGNYFRTDAETAALGQLLTKGLISILAGAFCVMQWEWFFVTFPVLAMACGSLILLTGISKIQLAVDMVRLKNSQWRLAAVNAVLTLICAIVVLCNPFASTEVLWLFTGVTLVGVGIFDLAVVILRRKAKGRDAYES
ncbi:HdeD family acid-resistance protein [Dysosmobacter sp.]|jgi:uncharacterized membrane protein HdeD (DUF308 family)|uniref:HdeD family acid-resistance protein n=1 Tax=Dysosmobacter sp. TaxID=2591382 RepID=UPI003D8C4DF0